MYTLAKDIGLIQNQDISHASTVILAHQQEIIITQEQDIVITPNHNSSYSTKTSLLVRTRHCPCSKTGHRSYSTQDIAPIQHQDAQQDIAPIQALAIKQMFWFPLRPQSIALTQHKTLLQFKTKTLLLPKKDAHTHIYIYIYIYIYTCPNATQHNSSEINERADRATPRERP